MGNGRKRPLSCRLQSAIVAVADRGRAAW
jgi:hypothetical protein